MLVSILHRVSGNGLAVGGLALLLWWLGAMAGGAESYASFTGWVWADLATLEWSGLEFLPSLAKVLLKLAVIGVSWAFFNHLCSGLRHFVMDIGGGYELTTNKRWSILSMIGGVVLTAAFWAAILLG